MPTTRWYVIVADSSDISNYHFLICPWKATKRRALTSVSTECPLTPPTRVGSQLPPPYSEVGKSLLLPQ